MLCSHSFAAATLSKSASEKLEHFCRELGCPVPAVSSVGSGVAMGGDEMLGRRRSAQVAESTFPRKVKPYLQLVHCCMWRWPCESFACCPRTTLTPRVEGEEGRAAKEAEGWRLSQRWW
jgi:hypothetical protein